MKKKIFLLLPFAMLFSTATSLQAGTVRPEEVFEMSLTELMNIEVVTATRSEKPMSQVAENVTVITAEEIKAINAHTLTDVLYHVPGMSIDIRGGTGSVPTFGIQGSDMRQVLVMVDGVALSDLGNFAANIANLPVKNIQRIEIIKGPASSAWGSSMGGVINIITKGDSPNEKFKGSLSASYGEADTVDSLAEVSGRLDNMGYYLNYNKIRTNGLTPNTPHDSDHFYGKLKWDLSERVDLLFTLGYMNADTGLGEMAPYDLSFHNNYSQIFSTAGLGVKLWEGADFNLSLRGRKLDEDDATFLISSGTEDSRGSNKDTEYGVNGKFSWKTGAHQLVAGMDYDHGQMDSNSFTQGNSHLLKRWAGFINDTISWRDFTFVPGFRYDHADTSGGFISPSIGATYKPWESVLFRSYVARGFNIPSVFHTFGTGTFYAPNPGLSMEKIRSYQVGAETTAVPYLWLKANLFRHDVSGAIGSTILSTDPLQWTYENKSSQRRQGFEIETRTSPIYHASLTAGYVFTDVKDLDTKTYIETSPRYTVDIGMQYNHPDIINAMLKGHYIWWNPYQGVGHNFNSFIWDLHLSREVYAREWGNVDLFLSARNIFNSSQYLIEFWKNPGRWVEGGVRVEF